MGRTVIAAGRGSAGRLLSQAVLPLGAVALAVAGGASKAAADWVDGVASPSAVAATMPHRTSPLAGLPGFGVLGDSPLMSRGPRLAALVPPVLSGDALLSLGPVDAAFVPDTPIVSGLPWRSGAACADPAFEAWRGRRMDVNVTFAPHTSWKSMQDFLAAPHYRKVAQQTPQMVASLALLPQSNKGQHAQCAAGAFDAEFRRMGATMVAAGAGQAIVRLGWEANVGADSHPWGIDRPDQVPAYIGCFQHAAAALKSTAPGLKIEWTNAKRGSLDFNVLDSYPGDAYVDLFGIHYYDSDPPMPTQALWDERLNAVTKYGQPHGIAQWVRTAQAYGRKLAISEWALKKLSKTQPADNAVYIDNMYRFLRANAETIAYESYFNCNEGKSKIYPGTYFPQANLRYQTLWSGGQ